MYFSEFCDVRYIQSYNVVLVEWKKFCNGEDYRKPLMHALDIIRKYDGCNYVADTRNGFECVAEDTQWVADYFMPYAVSYGCKFIFFIIDSNNSLKEELEEQKSDSNNILHFRYIHSLYEVADYVEKISFIKPFLEENEYVDYCDKIIQDKSNQLFSIDMNDIQKAKIAYEFVRDDIPHSFDCNADVITAKASDVLKNRTGICHAKANLLAALLRSQKIPVGFCFEHITLAEDDSIGYCVHAYNAVYLNGNWIKLDARGNIKDRVNAQFSLDEPILAYPPRKEYDEYFFKGIYANPHLDTMSMLNSATCLQDIINNIPEFVNELPDIIEEA